MSIFKEIFGNDIPLMYSVAEKYGHGEELLSLFSKVYLKNSNINDPKLIETILLVAQYHCTNKYCAVAHSLALWSKEVSLEEIQAILDRFAPPFNSDDDEKWSII